MSRLLIAAALMTSVVTAAHAAEPFELRDGDTVAFVGDGLFEGEMRDCYIETALTLAWADRGVTFRNLGWTGDTPEGTARSYFGPPEEGYKRLFDELNRIKPTVVILSYGSNASFAGDAGLDGFLKDYARLIGDLKKITPRLVLLSPTPMENLGPPLPDPAPHNVNRAAYTEALRSFAAKQDCVFVDLYTPLKPLADDRSKQLTHNGIHLLPLGYIETARAITRALDPQRYSESFTAANDLRKAIVEKTELYFHRYRPANETYLRGFRKHEQGNNAVEIAKFDPLIEQKDKQIAELAKAAKGGAK
ncbi:MAG: hypothetical protein GC159_08735 [Phycisphaera sp.]|nr:hypothetical protein [Phycisphaera sp.]